jgi:hypothetical protein
MGSHDNHSSSDQDNRDMLYLFGGLALIVLGVGLVITNRKVRQAVDSGLAGVLPELKGKILPDLSSVGSDVERYLKIRSM